MWDVHVDYSSNVSCIDLVQLIVLVSRDIAILHHPKDHKKTVWLSSNPFYININAGTAGLKPWSKFHDLKFQCEECESMDCIDCIQVCI